MSKPKRQIDAVYSTLAYMLARDTLDDGAGISEAQHMLPPDMAGAIDRKREHIREYRRRSAGLVDRKENKAPAPLAETVYAQDGTVIGPPLVAIGQGDYETKYYGDEKREEEKTDIKDAPGINERECLEKIISQLPVDRAGYPLILGGECKICSSDKTHEGLWLQQIYQIFSGNFICTVDPLGEVFANNLIMVHEGWGDCDWMRAIVNKQPRSGDGAPLWVGRKGCFVINEECGKPGFSPCLVDIISMSNVGEDVLCIILNQANKYERREKANEIFVTIDGARSAWEMKNKAENAKKNEGKSI